MSRELRELQQEQEQYQMEIELERKQARSEALKEGHAEGIIIAALKLGITDEEKIASLIVEQTDYDYGYAVNLVKQYKGN